MVSQLPPTSAGTRPGKRAGTLRAVGFLTALVGILTICASASPLDSELRSLDRLENRRTRILAEADSIGHLLANLPARDNASAGRLLRKAEGLGEESRDLDLEILLARDRCRSLAIRELESVMRSDSTGAAARENALVDLLEGRLSQPPQGDFVLVEPDSSDGYETLLDKQAYLDDLRDRIVSLDRLSGERVERLAREQSLLRASEGLIEESRFLDEGGRVGSGDLLLHQPGDPPEGPGHARSVGSVVGTGREDQPLSSAPSESTSIGRDLAQIRSTRARLKEDLARVDSLLRTTEALLDRYVPTSR